MNDFDLAVLDLLSDPDLSFLAVYVKRQAPQYNPDTGENEATENRIPVRAALLDLNLRSNGLGALPGTLIQDGDKELYVRPPHKEYGGDPMSVDPTNDYVIVNGVNYKIVTMKEINPTAQDPMAYLLYIRK